MKKKPRGTVQETVDQLSRMAAATQLAMYLLEAGWVRDAIILPPVFLSKSEMDRWPNISTERN